MTKTTLTTTTTTTTTTKLTRNNQCNIKRPPSPHFSKLYRKPPDSQLVLLRHSSVGWYKLAALLSLLILLTSNFSTLTGLATKPARRQVPVTADAASSNTAKPNLKQYQAQASDQLVHLNTSLSSSGSSNNNIHYHNSSPLVQSATSSIIYSYPKNSTLLGSSHPQQQQVNQTNQPRQQSEHQLHQRHQSKSFKFTLIGGKFWKFSVKPNTFSNYNQVELRLHKNISANNYIIDDDFWFQYDPFAQQFFAWPSLTTKPGTYYLVLLPSGLDFEDLSSTGDNSLVTDTGIAANIVIELIRPLYQTSETTDVDLGQLIDHKFSLEFLHRRSNYPLLLQQIIAVLEIISTKAPVASAHPLDASIIESSTNKFRPQQQQNKTNLQSDNKQINRTNLRRQATARLSEYLLINFNQTNNGEYFSISWSYHQSLTNNTISRIQDCRTSVINSTVNKLSSSPSTALLIKPTHKQTPLSASISNSSSKEECDRLFVHYQIDPLNANLGPIVPTERGNFSLKLTLCQLCQTERVLYELGLITLSLSDINNETKVIDNNTISDPVPEDQAHGLSNAIVSESNLSPQIVSREAARQRNFTISERPEPSSTAKSSTTTEVTTLVTEPSPPPSINITRTSASIQGQGVTIEPVEHFESSTHTDDLVHKLATVATISNTTNQGFGTNSKDQTLHPSETEVPQKEIPLVIGPSPTVFDTRSNSFANFLDLNESSHSNMTTETPSSPLMVQTTTLPSIKPDIFMPTVIYDADNATATKSTISTTSPTNDLYGHDVGFSTPSRKLESTLNDDFIYLLNDVTEYIVSITVPIAILVGVILFLSIIIALCNLFKRRRKSKEIEVRNRFDFRYQSERRAFMKSSSRPVILDSDDKSLSMSGTPKKISTSLGGFIGTNAQGDDKFGHHRGTNRDSIVYMPMDTMNRDSTIGSTNVPTNGQVRD